MRILLLNDTSNNFHLGCAAVTNTIRQFLFKIDGIELRTIFNRELRCNDVWQFPPMAKAWFIESIRWCDLLIVNGEGSLHHSRSPEIVRALQIAEEEAVPFCVVNSILEDFPSLLPVLARAEVVTLRDGASLQTAMMAGLPAVRCADAALFASFSDLSTQVVGNEIGVTDWHPMAPPEAGQTATAHLANGSRYYPLSRPDANWVWPAAVKDFGHFRHIVCGRYHGALFALLAARPLTLLPSNSWKMRQLLIDLSVSTENEISAMNWPIEVSESSARLAREQLLLMRATPELHPLFGVDVNRRKYHIAPVRSEVRSMRPMTGLPEAELLPTVLARRIADWLTFLGVPASRRERLNCDDVLAKAGADVLRRTAEFLTLEGQAPSAAWVLGKLVEVGTSASAFPIALELRNRTTSSAEANFVFSLIANSCNDALSASTFSKIADDQKPLSGPSARLAARFAGRAGDNQTKARLLQNYYGSAANVSGEQWRELTVTAGLAGLPDLTLQAARAALQTAHALTGWPGIQVANMLASMGAFVEGCKELSRLLPSADEAYKQLMEAVSTTGVDTVVYIPPMVGVGSAIIAAMPLLLRDFQLEGPGYLIVDERLHPAFSRVLGGRVTLLPNTEALNHANIGRLVNGFDLLAEFGARYGEQSSPAFMEADPARAADLRNDYRHRFGRARLIGLAWHTSNQRSGRWRNLPIGRLRTLLSKHSKSVFVSLQPDLAKALADRDVIMQNNLFVDTRIDPSQSIEDQLAQISVLDHVISIDCSSGIFAAALGIQSTIILNGEPTWQWPERQSFLGAVSIVTDLTAATELLSSPYRSTK